MWRRRGLGLAALLAVSALTLSACTGGSGPPASTPAATISQRAAPPSASCHTPAPKVLNEVEPSVVTVRTPHGLGSGIVFKPDIIITDHHVVAKREGQPQTFERVKIVLADGSTTPGTVVGGDLRTDVAVIRTKRKKLPPLKFHTSSLPAQGQTVLAVGSPLGLSNTASRGIVSALGRDLPAHGGQIPLVNLIQTDAAISPGNSGGALVDLCGRVVGVNEAYIPPKTGAVSIGFATPVPVAVNVAQQLLSKGSVSYPAIGVAVHTLTPQIKKALGVKADHGVVVLQVANAGPAAQAGVQRGDIITHFNAEQIGDYADLLGAVRKTHPGQTVTLTVSRNGNYKKLKLTIETRGPH
jgi:S1-C subfamily serine protease